MDGADSLHCGCYVADEWRSRFSVHSLQLSDTGGKHQVQNEKHDGQRHQGDQEIWRHINYTDEGEYDHENVHQKNFSISW